MEQPIGVLCSIREPNFGILFARFYSTQEKFIPVCIVNFRHNSLSDGLGNFILKFSQPFQPLVCDVIQSLSKNFLEAEKFDALIFFQKCSLAELIFFSKIDSLKLKKLRTD